MTNQDGHTTRRTRKRLSPRTIGIRKKQARAVELRRDGLTLQQIANELGYRDDSAAGKAIQASLGRVESAAAADLRALYDERSRKAVQVIMETLSRTVPDLEVPDDVDPVDAQKMRDRHDAKLMALADLQLKAINTLMRVAERDARLHGLDEPVKAEVNGQQVTIAFHSALQFPQQTVIDAQP